MAYSDIALLAVDADFGNRISASAASEAPDGLPNGLHPVAFTSQYQWQIAGAPGFGDAYASALAGGVERPGNDPSVISDAQILAVVQPIIESLGVPPAAPSP